MNETDETNQKKAVWKRKAAHELIEYWANFVYLALFFGAFAWYRRFILAEYRITYFHYGVAIIEALVLAKVILIGDWMRLGRRFEEKPLLFATLYKTVIFMLFVAVFGVLERTVAGLFRGRSLLGIWQEFRGTSFYELLARTLVTFLCFIPFFAFRELNRVLGEGKIRKLFFRGRSVFGPFSGSNPDQPAH